MTTYLVHCLGWYSNDPSTNILSSKSDLGNASDTIESETIITACFRNGTVDRAETESMQPTLTNQLASDLPWLNQGTSLASGATLSDHQRIAIRYSFEFELEASRVYKRTQLLESDVSFTSSAIRTHAWSIFSGLSLSQFSNILVIALPLYSHEISNGELYSFPDLGNAEPSRTIQPRPNTGVDSSRHETSSNDAILPRKILIDWLYWVMQPLGK